MSSWVFHNFDLIFTASSVTVGFWLRVTWQDFHGWVVLPQQWLLRHPLGWREAYLWSGTPPPVTQKFKNEWKHKRRKIQKLQIWSAVQIWQETILVVDHRSCQIVSLHILGDPTSPETSRKCRNTTTSIGEDKSWHLIQDQVFSSSGCFYSIVFSPSGPGGTLLGSAFYDQGCPLEGFAP